MDYFRIANYGLRICLAQIDFRLSRVCTFAASLILCCSTAYPQANTVNQSVYNGFTESLSAYPLVSGKKVIPFSWSYHANKLSTHSALGLGWNHSLDFRLFRDQENLELIKPDGTSLIFYPIDHELFQAKNLEKIEKFNRHYHWHSNNRTTIFYGSYPVTVRDKHSTIKLRYTNNQLDTIYDNNGNELHLSYSKMNFIDHVAPNRGEPVTFQFDQFNRLASSSSAGITKHYSYTSSPPVMLCLPNEINAQPSISKQNCDNTTTPPPSTFTLSPQIANSIKIDLRPQSCRSYFTDYNGIKRGVELEGGMLSHPRYITLISTVRSFPIVDFIDGNVAIAVHSKDLNSKTYSSPNYPNGLYKSIVVDGKNAHEKFLEPLQEKGTVSATEKGNTTTINNNEIDSLTMELMIRAGVATPDQINQINRARLELLKRWKIKLVVVEIP